MARDVSRYIAAERALWEHVGVEPEERWVTLATGGRVRVQVVGEGLPVVFVHGGSVCGTSWCTLAAALDGVQCLLVDRPGCGLSDPVVDAPFRTAGEVAAHADGFLADLLDGLELDRAAVAATSYGGYFAFRGAAAAPDRVTRLVEYSWLIGAPNESAPFSARLAGVPGVKSLMARVPMSRGMVKRGLRQFGLGKAIDSGTFDDVMLDWVHALMAHTEIVANEMATMPDIITPIRGQNEAVLLDDDLLARLAMPVLFLWGSDDPNGGARVARSFAPRLPDAELIVLDGAEHAPWLDDPATCVTETQRFLGV